jgi:hypothetical protein
MRQTTLPTPLGPWNCGGTPASGGTARASSPVGCSTLYPAPVAAGATAAVKDIDSRPCHSARRRRRSPRRPAGSPMPGRAPAPRYPRRAGGGASTVQNCTADPRCPRRAGGGHRDALWAGRSNHSLRGRGPGRGPRGPGTEGNRSRAAESPGASRPPRAAGGGWARAVKQRSTILYSGVPVAGRPAGRSRYGACTPRRPAWASPSPGGRAVHPDDAQGRCPFEYGCGVGRRGGRSNTRPRSGPSCGRGRDGVIGLRRFRPPQRVPRRPFR